MAYSAFSGLNSGNAGIKQTVRQANDFAVGDVVRLDGSNYVKAIANSSANAEVVGVVETSSSAQFTVVFAGEVNLSEAASKPSEGVVYFLSDSVAGGADSTPPLTTGTVKKTVYIGSNNDRAIIVNYLGLKNGFEGGDQVSLTGISPVGQIIPYAGIITSSTQVPDGWLLCAGGVFNSTDYPELATLLGETYGPRTGTNYSLPDLRGRVPVGVNQNTDVMDMSPDQPTPRVLGEEGGMDTHSLSINELASHTHTSSYVAYRDEMGTDTNRPNTLTPTIRYGPIDSNGTIPGQGDIDPDDSTYQQIMQNGPILSNDWPNWDSSGDDCDYGLVNEPILVENQGGGQPHNNMQPFIVTNWLIRANSNVSAAILTVNVRSLADVDATKSYDEQSGGVLMWGAANDAVNPLNAKAGADKFIINPVSDSERNALINGNFDVWQRGVSFPTAAGGAWVYTADRWFQSQNAPYPVTGNTVRTSDGSSHPFRTGQTNVPGTHSLSYTNQSTATSFAAGDYNMIGQLVEGFNFASLWSAGYMTVSFWVRGDTPGTYNVCARNQAYSRSYVTKYNINAAGTWEYKTMTIPMDTANPTLWNFTDGVGLRLEFLMGKQGANWNTTSPNEWESGSHLSTSDAVNIMTTASGGDAKWQITQVQLEAGRIATPLQPRKIQDEISMCERYYEKSYDLNTVPGTPAFNGAIHSNDWVVTNTAHINASFRTRKRRVPTVTIYNPKLGTKDSVFMLHRESGTSENWGVGSVSRGTTNIHRIVRNSGTWVAGYKNKLNFHYVADAELSAT